MDLDLPALLARTSALDNVADIAIQKSVPAVFWCSQSLVGTNFNGGCR